MNTSEEIIRKGLSDLASKEKRDEMLEEAVRFFLEMKSKMESGDPQKREEAQERLALFQAQLLDQEKGCRERTGLAFEEFEALSRQEMEHEAVLEARAKLQKIFYPGSRPKRKDGRIPV